MVDVPYVELEFLLPGDGVAAMTLGPAGDARAHFVAPCLLGRIERKILHKQRAGADERHIAFENVPKLGEFIDGGGADEAANFGEAVGVGEQLAVDVALVGHTLELHPIE